MTDLTTALKRASFQPARVFGRADVTDDRRPVVLLDDGSDYDPIWVLPHYGEWAIHHDKSEGPIARALDQYGSIQVESPAYVNLFIAWLNETPSPAKIEGDPFLMADDAGRESPRYVIRHNDGFLVTYATPIAYAQRYYPGVTFGVVKRAAGGEGGRTLDHWAVCCIDGDGTTQVLIAAREYDPNGRHNDGTTIDV